MKVYFVGGWDKERLLAEVNTTEEAMKVMNDFMKEHNFKSYYTRVYKKENSARTRYDVGSWTQFFETED